MAKDWAVIDMDGDEISRHATAQQAEEAVEAETTRFRRKHGPRINGDGAYLPRSVCYLPDGAKPQRAGRYSTSWVGLTPPESAYDYLDA